MFTFRLIRTKQKQKCMTRRFVGRELHWRDRKPFETGCSVGVTGEAVPDPIGIFDEICMKIHH